VVTLETVVGRYCETPHTKIWIKKRFPKKIPSKNRARRGLKNWKKYYLWLCPIPLWSPKIVIPV